MSEQNRWRIKGCLDKDFIHHPEGGLAAEVMSLGSCMQLIQAANFCAGIHVETLTLLNQSGHPTLTQWCEENQRLRADISRVAERFKCESDIAVTVALTFVTTADGVNNGLRAAVKEKDREIERLKNEMRSLIGDWKWRVYKEMLPTSDEFISELDALLNGGSGK